MTKPKISVYIPTHNRYDMLLRAMYSVLAQDYPNIELIVCDDGSSDATFERVSKLFADDDRVILIRNDIPQGANFSRNRAIQIATGEFVTGLDDDDFFMPTRLSTLFDAYDDKYAFVYSSILECGKRKNREFDSWHGKLSLKHLFDRNYVGNQVLVKRDRMLEIGCFDTSLSAWQDYDCWVRLQLRYGDSYGVPRITYILDTSHDSPRITLSNKVQSARIQFLEKYAHLMSKYNKKVHNSDYILSTKSRISIFDFLYYGNKPFFKRFVYRCFVEKFRSW